MRGDDRRSGSLFSYVDIEKRVRPDHPLRTIKTLVDEALSGMSREFAALYSRIGRPSVPPEQLLRAMLLQAFSSIRSERQLMERIEFDLLYRWFIGLGIDDPAWDATTFTKNRDRLLEGAIAHRFLAAVLAIPRVKRLLSNDHFSVDGTLIEAWASMKSFRPKDEGADGPPADPPIVLHRDVMPRSTSTARRAATTRTPASPIPTRASTARDAGAKPSSAISAMS